MKKFILSVAIAATVAACNNHTSDRETAGTQNVSAADTAGLSEFKEWKQKQEQVSTQTFTSEGVHDSGSVTEIKPAEPVVIYRDAPVRQRRVASSPKPIKQRVYQEAATEPENNRMAKAPIATNPGSKREAYGRGRIGTEGTAGSGTTTSEGQNGDVAVGQPAETPAKKDGWSKAAKGTAIGGASGAVIGAVISKNKGKGAVIGGILGAAGGYIFGRKQDKKDGRAQADQPVQPNQTSQTDQSNQ